MPLTTFLRGRTSVTTLRGLKAMALTEVATIQKNTPASDAGGGGTAAWANSGTTVCRIYPVTVRGQGRITGGALEERSTHYLVTPPDTSIGLADRVLIANRGTFEVTMTLERTDPFTHVYETFQVL